MQVMQHSKHWTRHLQAARTQQHRNTIRSSCCAVACWCVQKGAGVTSSAAEAEVMRYQQLCESQNDMEEWYTEWQKDPLEWWKLNEKHFPRHARLARKYLSCQLSQSACERVFSISQDVNTLKRKGRMKAEHSGKLTFCKANLSMKSSPFSRKHGMVDVSSCLHPLRHCHHHHPHHHHRSHQHLHHHQARQW